MNRGAIVVLVSVGLAGCVVGNNVRHLELDEASRSWQRRGIPKPR